MLATLYGMKGKSIEKALERRWDLLVILLSCSEHLISEFSFLQQFVSLVTVEHRDSTVTEWKNLLSTHSQVRDEFLLKSNQPPVPITFGSPLWSTMISFMIGFEATVRYITIPTAIVLTISSFFQLNAFNSQGNSQKSYSQDILEHISFTAAYPGEFREIRQLFNISETNFMVRNHTTPFKKLMLTP